MKRTFFLLLTLIALITLCMAFRVHADEPIASEPDPLWLETPTPAQEPYPLPGVAVNPSRAYLPYLARETATVAIEPALLRVAVGQTATLTYTVQGGWFSPAVLGDALPVAVEFVAVPEGCHLITQGFYCSLDAPRAIAVQVRALEPGQWDHVAFVSRDGRVWASAMGTIAWE